MFLFITVILTLAALVVYIAAMWRVFTKAGEAGWKAIIPIYNTYIMFKIAWKTKMFIVFIGIVILTFILTAASMATAYDIYGPSTILLTLAYIPEIASFVISVMLYYNLSKAFGHGGGFTVGLVLLNFIFVLILGFGSSRYIKMETQNNEQNPTGGYYYPN